MYLPCEPCDAWMLVSLVIWPLLMLLVAAVGVPNMLKVMLLILKDWCNGLAHASVVILRLCIWLLLLLLIAEIVHTSFPIWLALRLELHVPYKRLKTIRWRSGLLVRLWSDHCVAFKFCYFWVLSTGFLELCIEESFDSLLSCKEPQLLLFDSAKFWKASVS